MNIFILFLLIFSAFTFGEADPVFSQLELEKKTMSTLLLRAYECIPTVENGLHTMCTGVTFKTPEWDELKSMSFDQCVQKINTKGYATHFSKTPGFLKKYPQFIASTLRAETVHLQKYVLFKDVANRIDCFHELLHVYQQDPQLENELAPVKRAEREKKFIELLNAGVLKVEALEKEKKIEEAQSLSTLITSYITFIKSWERLNTWLDEKDDHYFIYQNCTELSCTPLDGEIALSNLYLYRNYFPKKQKSEIEIGAMKMIDDKEQKELKSIKDKWKKIPFGETEISGLLGKSWKETLSYLKKKGIKVYKVRNISSFKGFEDYTIPTAEFNKIPDLPKTFVDEGSKLLKGEAFAKYFCGKKSSIGITSFSTVSSVVHEYLHHLQAINNPEYCTALNQGPQLKMDFEAGKMPRETYETQAIKNNVIFWMAEFEVYEKLLRHPEKISKLEQLNNLELYKKYKMKLGL
jgi:hypothetical protein